MNISRLSFKAAVTGFSLIEMAVVIVVLTIILAVIAQPVANQIETRRVADTQRKLEEVKEALYGYALAKGYLPRPATSATNGTEMAACATEELCTGLIPWRTLGIEKSDAWGAIIRYSATQAMTTATAAAVPTFTLSTGGSKDVLTRSTSGAQSELASKVAAVVWSHGKRNFGTDAETGIPRPPNTSATNTDEAHNNTVPAIGAYPIGTAVFSRLPTDNTATPGGEFDDLVSWIPTSILMGKMVQAGRLP